MIRRALILVPFLLLAAGSLAGEEQPRQVLLRHRFTPGETFKYRGQVRGEGSITLPEGRQAVKIEGRFSLTQKVLQVADDGAARIATTVEDGLLILRTPAVSQRLPISLPTLTQTITPDGRLLASRGWEALPEGPRPYRNLRRVIQRLHLLRFPEHPVAVGDSWPAPAPKSKPQPPTSGPSKAGTPPLSWKLTLIGFRRVAGRECAKIRALAESPIKQVLPPDGAGDLTEIEGQERLESISDFALADGRVVRQVASAHTTLCTLTHSAAGGQPVAGETDITAKVTLELRQPRQ